MKKGPIIILTALFLFLSFAPWLAEAKAFSWTIDVTNHQTVSAPGGVAALGTTVNISSVWTYGWKDARRCKTSFITELLRNGAVVSTLRCLPDLGCVKDGIIGSEWISTGCVQYCYGGCWVGPIKPVPDQTAVADTIRARLCYSECGGGGVNQFQYDEFGDHRERISTVFVADAEKDLGSVGSLANTASTNNVRVSTTTQGVLLWVGGIDDKTQKSTSATDADVWACVDNDQNNLCDANEGASHTCLSASGDWYRGQCCGTLFTCGYSAQAKAFCGKTLAGQWEWAPLDEPGQIHVLDDCPSAQVVSNGTALFSCGKAITGAQQMQGILRINISGVTHAFSCANNVISECSGCADPSQCAFSSDNALAIGSRAPGTTATYYCSSDGDWTTDLDAKDEASCTAAGFSWTGKLCCGEADDAGEYYNDPSYPDALGGCWNRQGVRSGDFAVADKVINYHGEFFGCRLSTASSTNILSLIDTHKQAPNNWLVNNSITPCGAFLPNAQPGGNPNAVCQPDGKWVFTNETFGIYSKSIQWSGAVSLKGISLSGCCPLDRCWNGTSCQSRGAFYRVGEQGFLCDYPPAAPINCVPKGCIMPACSARLSGECAAEDCIPVSCFSSMANDLCITPGCAPANSNTPPGPVPIGGGAMCTIFPDGSRTCIA